MITEQNAVAMNHAPTNAWNLYLDTEICQNVREGFDHEWLVTNGLGGYGAGTINGATTRSYHGLLVAALHPPIDRTVLVTKIDEEVAFPDGHLLKLGVNEYKGGIIDPQGYQYLERAGLEGDIPYFSYRLSETLTLEKRIWMEYGQNTTYVQYILQGSIDEESERSEQALTLSLLPFCLSRDYHNTTRGAQDWHFLLDNTGNRYRIHAREDAAPVYIIAGPSATFTPTGYWYWHTFHIRDSERGLPSVEDVYQPGIFRISITPGQHVTLVLSAEAGSDLSTELGGPQHEEHVAQALSRHYLRLKQLLAVADPSSISLSRHNPVQARLVVAADQFIVARPDYANGNGENQPLRLSPDRKTIIAGYPWFTDWGRDSMISLPGLLLSTGRFSEARGLLKAFASFTHDGLIPNRFPDSGAPEYNTVDATLWMFHAIQSYLSTTGDWTLLKELFSTLANIIQWHVKGTEYGIGVDPHDGLLRGGAPGVQLTWMDAKVDNLVVTPRQGKPVEVNALWYCALTYMEAWAVHLSIDATQYSRLREQVSQNFAPRFWYEAGGYLYDVVDVDGVAGQNDPSLRPNQLFAASLTHILLSEEQMRSMFQQVTEHLLTPMGLRSLSPDDPNYHNHFNGDPKQRDNAYHLGAVWPWLIGPYIDVHLYLNNNRGALLPLLQPLIDHLWVACLGTISEVAEPEPPYTPGGCFAQAWSVAELLRCWLLATG